MASRRLTTILYAATMGLAGFLLFQVQPVMAKYILPWFGGSATTWIVCMLFFQVALLGGYAYAYAVTQPLSVRAQALLHIALLAGMLVLLPITPADSWKPADSGNPTWRIIALLAVSVGGPYMLLATTSPLLQRWLTRVDPGIDFSGC
jgi:NADH:ubiquinone oxidoreductase subunit 4 (subunit M)